MQGPHLATLSVWPLEFTCSGGICSTAVVAAIATCTSLCSLHLAGVAPELLHSISSLTSLTELHIKLAYSDCESVNLEVHTPAGLAMILHTQCWYALQQRA